jgi:hypothetical protein
LRRILAKEFLVSAKKRAEKGLGKPYLTRLVLTLWEIGLGNSILTESSFCYGVATNYPVERFLRDSQIIKTDEGTNDIQRLTIAKQLLKELKAYRKKLALANSQTIPYGEASIFSHRKNQHLLLNTLTETVHKPCRLTEKEGSPNLQG